MHENPAANPKCNCVAIAHFSKLYGLRDQKGFGFGKDQAPPSFLLAKYFQYNPTIITVFLCWAWKTTFIFLSLQGSLNCKEVDYNSDVNWGTGG